MMNIVLSQNIDAPSCTACSVHRPWTSTIAKIEAKLRANNVVWRDFMIMHWKNMSCAAVRTADHHRGLYVVAMTPNGAQATRVALFARKTPYYVGIDAILRDRAFQERVVKTTNPTGQGRSATKSKERATDFPRRGRAQTEITQIPLVTGDRQREKHQKHLAEVKSAEETRDSAARDMERRVRENAASAADTKETERKKAVTKAMGEPPPDSELWDEKRSK
jgi:hypothetical protein